MRKTNDNNFVRLEGVMKEAPVYSHTLHGEAFYTFPIQVNRLSPTKDVLNVTISERQLLPAAEAKEAFVRISGELRTYNKMVQGRNRLILTVFAKTMEEPRDRAEEPNFVHLKGFICKEPIYRKTPFGREITDLLLAVNRNFNKSDYIPVLTWGEDAQRTSAYGVGERVDIIGRLQSRTYTKVLESGATEERVAFEVSASELELVSQSEAEKSSSMKASQEYLRSVEQRQDEKFNFPSQ